LNVPELLHDVDKLIDRHQLAVSQVNHLVYFAFKDGFYAPGTIVDVPEAAGENVPIVKNSF